MATSITRHLRDPVLFRHLIEQARGVSGSVYGRHMYEVMRYWDEDDPAWTTELREFAEAWRKQSTWVASRSAKVDRPQRHACLG
jgi:hypothetical protein